MPSITHHYTISTSSSQDGSSDVGRTESEKNSRKASGACVHCKSLKVRCEFSPGESVCKRCRAGGHECLDRLRKKRTPAPTHEDLVQKSQLQDSQIHSLLHQIDDLKAKAKISEWMVSTQSDAGHVLDAHNGQRNGLQRRQSAQNDSNCEMTVRRQFPLHHATGIGMQIPALPDIVKHCALYPHEIQELFIIFFDKINPFFSILDPELHTPSRLIWTSHFLFTAVIAVASRFYPKRSGFYYLSTQFAKDAAGKALVDGSLGIDICQAFLIMAVYPVPKKNNGEDKRWLMMANAINMAKALGLDQPSPPTCNERESLNRTRTWLNCFCVDMSHAVQSGKNNLLRCDDYLARHSRDWHLSSVLNLPIDIHLCGYVELLLAMGEFRLAVGENIDERVEQGLDVVNLVVQYDERLARIIDFWASRYAAQPKDYITEPVCVYRGNTTQLIAAYLRLVVLSLGFSYAVKAGTVRRDSYLVQKSISVAISVIKIMTERLYPTGRLRFAMEANFLYVTFAAAFLLNLTRPKLLPLLNEQQHRSIVLVVNELIDVLRSEAVAIDGRHTPAIYAKFLGSLLTRHLSPCSALPPPPTSPRPGYGVESPPSQHLFQWPPTSSRKPPSLEIPCAPLDYLAGANYQLDSAESDFSMEQFLTAVSVHTAQSPTNFTHTPSYHDSSPTYFKDYQFGKHDFNQWSQVTPTAYIYN